MKPLPPFKGWIRGVGLYALALMPWVCLAAPQVTLDIQPRAIRLNEFATLKLNFINLNPTQAPTLPDVPGFDIYYMGQEQHFQFVNGNQERRLTFSYRLQPRAAGSFQLGPFSMNFSGQDIAFEAIPLEVLPASSGSAGGQTGQEADDLVFARLSLPRNRVFIQERFDVELSLFFRGVNLDRGVQLLNLPSTGLHLEDFQELGGGREVFNNELYEVRRFRMRGTALTAGTFELAPMVRVNVLVRRERSRDPFFGDFDLFFGRRDVQPLTVAAPPTEVTIRPLPVDGRPPGFGGAVGRFNMEMALQPQDVMAGEPITLTLRITGQGNFETISMPPLDLGDNFRRYDPKLMASGPDHKVFEQVFIPRSDAIKELPPVTFSFFDPESGNYQTVVRGPYPLTVRAGAPETLQLVQGSSLMSAPDRSPLGIDIISLKRTTDLTAAHRVEQSAQLSAPLYVAPILGLAGLLFFQRRRERQRGDVRRRRRSMAPRSARTALRAAEEALAREDATAFHQSLWQALADYVAHRANLEAGEVSPDLILRIVTSGGMPPARVEALDRIIRECEEARFAHAGQPVDPGVLKARLNAMQDMLRTMEKTVRL